MLKQNDPTITKFPKEDRNIFLILKVIEDGSPDPGETL